MLGFVAFIIYPIYLYLYPKTVFDEKIDVLCYDKTFSLGYACEA